MHLKNQKRELMEKMKLILQVRHKTTEKKNQRLKHVFKSF